MEQPARQSLRRIVTVIAILAGVAWAAPARAATEDCFLRVDGAQGDSADARHRGEIDVLTWSLAMTNTGAAAVTGSAGAAGRADFQPLKITQRVDRAVPALLQLGAAGQHVQAAVLTCRRAGRDAGDYLKVTLQEVLVAGVRVSDSPDGPPSAEVTLVYGRITIEYRPQMPDGSLGQPVVTGWDVRTNRRL